MCRRRRAAVASRTTNASAFRAQRLRLDVNRCFSCMAQAFGTDHPGTGVRAMQARFLRLQLRWSVLCFLANSGSLNSLIIPLYVF